MVVDGAGDWPGAHAVDRGVSGVPTAPPLRTEAFTCRSDRWWAARRQPGAMPEFRIEDGCLQFQPQTGPVFELVREDVLIKLHGSISRTRRLLRLLPAWASVRLTAPSTPRSDR
jgi:hypothetical protein